MAGKITHCRKCALLIAAAVTGLGAWSAAGQTPATWTGTAGDGRWNTPTNWSGTVVPLNDVSTTYAVTTGDNKGTILFDAPVGASAITNLSLGTGTTLEIAGGRTLSVMQDATFRGTLRAKGASAVFNLPGPGIADLTNGGFEATAGGHLTLANASQYNFDTADYRASRTMLLADGAGSLLELPNATSLSVAAWGHNAAWSYSVAATNGGAINLSAVNSVTGAGQDDWLRFGISNGGQINLNSLATLTGGRVWFDLGAGSAMTLPAATSMTLATVQFTLADSATLNIPNLTSLANATVSLGNNASMAMLNLTSLSGASLTLGTNANLSMPALTSLTDSGLTLSPGRTITVGTVSNIDQSRLAVTGGTSLAFGAVTSYTTGYRYDADRVLLSADGAGSKLDLSNMTTLDASGMHGSNIYNYSIVATNGGGVDLSGVTSLKGARNDSPGSWTSDDWLRLYQDATGSLKLNSLASVTYGRVKFELGAGASLSLPALTNMSSGAASFVLADSATMNLPELLSLSSAGFTLGSNASINLPKLQSLTSSSFTLGANATVSAPMLSSLVDCDLSLVPGKTVVLGTLATIDHSRLAVAGGVSLPLPGVTSYTTSYRYDADRVLLSADGAGSKLDLSHVTTLDASGMYSGNVNNFSIVATNGGVVDLSGLVSLKGARYDQPGSWTSDDWLRLYQDATGSLKLNSLAGVSNGRIKFELGAGASLSLPALTSLNNGTVSFIVADNASINMPELVALNAAGFALGNNAAFAAPKLLTLTDSDLSLVPGKTMILGPLANVDHSRLNVSGGLAMNLGAVTTYTSSYRYDASRVLLSADGAGTKMDLSSLTTLDASGMYGNNVYSYSIVATNGAIIDLSAMSLLKGARNDAPGNWYSDDWLKLSIQSGGEIILGSLKQVVGRVWLDVQVPALNLPALETANAMQITTATGTTISMSALTSLSSSIINPGAGATVNMPQLTSLPDADLTVNGGQTFALGPISNIEASRIAVRTGALLTLPGVTSYTTNYRYDADRVLLSADGTGSKLALPAMLAMDASGMYSNAVSSYSVLATNGAEIDLSNVTSVKGARNDAPGQWYSDDWLRFSAQSGGVIKLPNLRQATGGTKFEAAAGSRITLGELAQTDRTSFVVSDPTGRLEFASLLLSANSSISAAPLAHITITDSFLFQMTSEAVWGLDGAVVEMRGQGLQFLEVGGTDKGLGDYRTANFAIGRLEVGQEGVPTTVQLLDLLDNGNRVSGSHEALYLGLGTANGLVIHTGSTVIIDNLNVYVLDGGSWVTLNSLFPAGRGVLSYSDGELVLVPEPSGLLTLATLAGLLVRRRR